MVSIVFCMSKGRSIELKDVQTKDSVTYIIEYNNAVLLLDSFLSDVRRYKKDPVGIKLLMSYKGETHLIDIHKISFIEICKRKVEVHVTEGEGKTYAAYAPVEELEGALGKLGFIRVSRFSLVAIAYIQRIRESQIHLKSEETVAIGRTYRKEFLERITGEPHIFIKRKN